MTVRDLIKELSLCDPDAKVFLYNTSSKLTIRYLLPNGKPAAPVPAVHLGLIYRVYDENAICIV